MHSISTIFGLINVLKSLAAVVMVGLLSVTQASAGQQGQIGIYDVNTGHGLTFSENPADPPAPLALRGYDTVSYFTDGQPQLGTIQHAALHNGAIYWFVSDAHAKMFKADPNHYLPQYGGFCAYGVTQLTKFDGDPLLWNIDKGKLYLNVTPDLQAKWLGKGLKGIIGNSLQQNISEANTAWPNISGAKPQILFMAWYAKHKK